MTKEKTVDSKDTICVEKKKCFVITPIGDEMSPIRRHIEGVIDAAIEPALGDNYEIIVSHRICKQGLITKQVIKEIYNDELFIANLTDRNPNVMYELALCHALGKPVIMIAEKNTPLPSDVIMQRTIFYYNDAQGVLELRSELIKAEKEIQFGQKTGPIVDVLGDISHDVVLLQQVKKESANEAMQMEYIMNRLNRIEDAVNSNIRREEYALNKYVRLRQLEYKFDRLSSDLTPNTVKMRLNRMLQINNSDARVLNVNIDMKNGTITVDLKLLEPCDFEEINRFVLVFLSELGVKGSKSGYFSPMSQKNDD